MNKNKNPIGWFEIPVVNMTRAVKFYNTLLKIELSVQNFGPISMAIFPHSDGYGSGGALVFNETYYKPSQNGALLYFGAPSGDLEKELGVVEKAGGKIISQKKFISKEHGFMALVLDPVGNRIALHSMK